MKQLPEIGTNVLTVINAAKHVVTIIAHYKDKAVYVYKTYNDFSRVDMATASNFEEIPLLVEKPVTEAYCSPGNHNYVQIGETHQKNAFCTRCGKTISLE